VTIEADPTQTANQNIPLSKPTRAAHAAIKAQKATIASRPLRENFMAEAPRNRGERNWLYPIRRPLSANNPPAQQKGRRPVATDGFDFGL